MLCAGIFGYYNFALKNSFVFIFIIYNMCILTCAQVNCFPIHDPVFLVGVSEFTVALPDQSVHATIVQLGAALEVQLVVDARHNMIGGDDAYVHACIV